MVFGEIGILPREYYLLLPRELTAIIEGYQNRQYKQSREKRFAAFLSILPFTKDITIEKFCRNFWPLPGDDLEQDAAIIEPVLIDPGTWDALKKQMKPKQSEYEKILSKHNLK